MSTPNFLARGNISPSVFVKQDTATDNGVLQAGANERLIGISQESGREPPLPSVSTNYAGISGDPMRVYGNTEQGVLLTLGTGGCAAGDLLKSDVNGCGVPIATSGATLQFYGARALTSGAAGEKIRVMVEIGQVYPALS